MSPLPADGLLDGSLLQVDVVVECGGALVVVRLEMERCCAIARLLTGAPAAGRWHGYPRPARRTQAPTVRARSLRTPFLFISCRRMSMSNFLQCWMYSWLPSTCLLRGQRPHAEPAAPLHPMRCPKIQPRMPHPNVPQPGSVGWGLAATASPANGRLWHWVARTRKPEE